MSVHIVEGVATICDLCMNMFVNDDMTGLDWFEPAEGKRRFDAMQAGSTELCKSLGVAHLWGGKHTRLYDESVKCECCGEQTEDTYLMDGVVDTGCDPIAASPEDYDTWEMYGDGPY